MEDKYTLDSEFHIVLVSWEISGNKYTPGVTLSLPPSLTSDCSSFSSHPSRGTEHHGSHP